MPAGDIFHETVKRSLGKGGRAITHDPLWIPLGGRRLFVDLGAERVSGVDGGESRVAVGLKGFAGRLHEGSLARAVGWYAPHEVALRPSEPERMLYLAVRGGEFREILDDPVGRLMIDKRRIRLLVLDEVAEAIGRWVP